MTRTLRTIRRSITAAVQAGQKLVTAVRGARFGLLVALYRAIDRETDVRIGYRDENGAETVRTITPRFLSISSKGHILVTGHDHLRGEKRTFRTDRMSSLNAYAEAA
jgi:predicted DNA-binding transcriptional regulator YafY